MKLLSAIFLLSGSLLFATNLRAQEARVHQTYEPASRTTKLLSSHLVLLDSPDQFLEGQLVAFWPGELMLGAPVRIVLNLTSRAPAELYHNRESHLFSTTELNRTDLGPMGFYGTYRQVSTEFPDIYQFTKRDVVRVPIPQTALVLASSHEALLTAEELFSRDIALNELLEMANAAHLTFRFEGVNVDLNRDQLLTVRAFAQSVTSSDRSAIAKSSVLENIDQPPLPVDTSSASLELTLSWLQKQIAASGRIQGISGSWVKTEIQSFSACNLTLRETTLSQEALEDSAILRPIVQYVVNLADLNPRSALVTRPLIHSVLGFSTVRFATLDNRTAIQVLVRQPVTGKEYERGTDYRLAINLQTDAAAFQVRDAMLRAIKLCSASP
jgi:hypothetical protein